MEEEKLVIKQIGLYHIRLKNCEQTGRFISQNIKKHVNKQIALYHIRVKISEHT